MQPAAASHTDFQQCPRSPVQFPFSHSLTSRLLGPAGASSGTTTTTITPQRQLSTTSAVPLSGPSTWQQVLGSEHHRLHGGRFAWAAQTPVAVQEQQPEAATVASGREEVLSVLQALHAGEGAAGCSSKACCLATAACFTWEARLQASGVLAFWTARLGCQPCATSAFSLTSPTLPPPALSVCSVRGLQDERPELAPAALAGARAAAPGGRAGGYCLCGLLLPRPGHASRRSRRAPLCWLRRRRACNRHGYAIRHVPRAAAAVGGAARGAWRCTAACAAASSVRAAQVRNVRTQEYPTCCCRVLPTSDMLRVWPGW